MATDYLTAAELARRPRLTPNTVRQMARDGRIPSIRLSPKVIRFVPQAVSEALTALWEKRTGEKVQAQFHRDTVPPEIRVGIVLDSWDAELNAKPATVYESLFAGELAAGDVEMVPTRTGNNRCFMRRIPIPAGSALAAVTSEAVKAAKWFVERASKAPEA
jgi:hypothetical protein